MVVVNGWTLYAHPLFLEQLEKLTAAVEKAQKKDPKGYQSSANAKLLAAMSTLGASRKHWFRAKFGGERFRLFFRYSSSAKIIIFAWVNDAQTLRTYGSKSDAYAVFKAMLDRGNPPEDWAALIAASSSIDPK
jgi:toxin YhaV